VAGAWREQPRRQWEQGIRRGGFIVRNPVYRRGDPGPHVAAGPASITTGPDGNIWTTEYVSDKAARITPQGKVTEFPCPLPKASRPGS